MNLADAVNTFAVRLYEWSGRDFCRELEAGCPLLSLIGQHQRRIGALVSWNENLSSSDRLQFAKATVLSFHENARNLKKEVITEQDRYWTEELYEQTTARMELLPPLLTADRNATTFRPSDEDTMINALSLFLPSVLGPSIRNGSNVFCTREFHDWRILTKFSFAEREGNLLSEYQFIRKDGSPVLEAGYGPFPRNLLSFYGIYPHTVVGVPSRADVEPMANAVTKLAEHFVSQAEPLFMGLGVND